MQLGSRPTAPPPADDLPSALRGAAQALGHRPAVTVLRPERREEQGFASLAQWAAKTAHWLRIEHELGPGGTVRLDGPPGWLPVALCLGAWWTGVAVRIGGPPADLAVVHESTTAPGDGEVVVYGDAVDGSPLGPSDHEPFAVAVQTFPDQPPAADAGPDTVALHAAGRTWTHTALLAAAHDLGSGVLGLDAALPPERWVPALAVHPLVTGRPTVLLAGADASAAAGERVDSWLSLP